MLCDPHWSNDHDSGSLENRLLPVIFSNFFSAQCYFFPWLSIKLFIKCERRLENKKQERDSFLLLIGVGFHPQKSPCFHGRHPSRPIHVTPSIECYHFSQGWSRIQECLKINVKSNSPCWLTEWFGLVCQRVWMSSSLHSVPPLLVDIGRSICAL